MKYLREPAKTLKKKIVKECCHRGVNISLENGKLTNGKAIFEVTLKGVTREAQLYAIAPDVQLKLKLPFFQFYRKGFSIYLVVSEQKIKYPGLLDVLRSPACIESAGRKQLPYVAGYNAMGEFIINDLVNDSHELNGGSTGSGKSVALRVKILSLVANKSVANVNLLLVDVGANDLMIFDGIQHLACPVIKDAVTGLRGLQALKTEMERRKNLANTNISEFDQLPRIVCVIDEFPALISGIADKQSSKILIETISSLLQRGRHSKIHLVLAAQNPTLQITKVGLANITARMAFKCAKPNFSEVILGERGAELLSGNGDMLFKSRQFDRIQRIQGIFISPDDLQWAISRIKERPFSSSDAEYKFTISDADLLPKESETGEDQMGKLTMTRQDIDERLFAEIVIWSLGREQISCNLICKTFRIGWNKANDFLKRLHNLHIVGDMYEKLPRVVLPVCLEDLPTETVTLLERFGYTSEHIEKALNAKGGLPGER
jgi:S-DNA-T family DNA segregation ATPase FtsK/SpoIIIE